MFMTFRNTQRNETPLCDAHDCFCAVRPYGSSERTLFPPESKDPYVISGFVLSPSEGLLLVDDVVMVRTRWGGSGPDVRHVQTGWGG